MTDNKVVKADLGKWPWATMFALLFTLIAGIVQIVQPSTLSFDDYMTQVVAVWSFLAVGRGLALKEQETIVVAPIDRFLNTFPWATVVTAVVAIVGYIGTLTGDSLTFNELTTKMAILIGALGVGRGLGVLKKDVTFNRLADPADLAGHPDYEGVEVPEGYDEPPLPRGLPAEGDEHMGASQEPPAKAPPRIGDDKGV